jgi:hypothetical protein
MIDVAAGVRTAFFQALNGLLTYSGAVVPVSDGSQSIPATTAMYVILGNQSSAQRNTFNGWATDETIDLDIIYKTATQGSRLPLDQVANQILEILLPTINTTALPVQEGLQFLNVVLSTNRYISLALNSSNTVERRILTFKLYVAQT